MFSLLLLALSAHAALNTSLSCEVYTKDSTNCAQDCGRCFNPGARKGVLCTGGASTGYYCTADNPTAGETMAFACMDWTFGSRAMQAAEKDFNQQTDDDVYFGVGTYGTSDDQQRGLGGCYRMTVQGVDKDLLVQSINTGSDVAGTQFDLQIGDGGAGAFNTCAGSDFSMYPGTTDQWGHIYGGVDHKAECAGLPPYPRLDSPMRTAGDNLITLCEYSFDKQVRREGGGNPSILHIERVQCPAQLVEFTQFQRTDDPSGYKFTKPAPSPAPSCTPPALEHCLTRMMDCRKPSGGFIDNVKPDLVVEGMKVVQPCIDDGYTRLDVQCGCMDCYC